MGVYKLWDDLRQAGAVVDLAGKECEREIAQTVDGLTIAVDVSIWMVQASMQPNLAEVFESPLARVLKVCFDRVSSLPFYHERWGCVEITVITPDLCDMFNPLTTRLAGKEEDSSVPPDDCVFQHHHIFYSSRNSKWDCTAFVVDFSFCLQSTTIYHSQENH